MALPTSQGLIQRFAMGLFGVQIGSETMELVQADLDRQPGNLLEKLDSAYNFYYVAGGFAAMDDEDVAAAFAANLGIVEGEYGLDEEAVALAVEVIAAELAGSEDKGSVINALLDQFAGLTDDEVFGEAATAWLANVDAGVEWAANNTDDAPVGAVVTEFDLTLGKDDLEGSASADVFSADVSQNVNGEQTNELATGDSIDGGAGTDTLKAYVQMGSALNNNPASAIRPVTVDVEAAEFTALTVDNSTAPEAAEEVVTINAAQMWGLDRVHSTDSDASLIIENLTTLTDSGEYADRRNTEEMTVRFDHGGNDAAVDAESDFTVLFDNDYLLAGQTSNSVIELRVVNALELADNDEPLAAVTEVEFQAGGQTITVDTTSIQALTGAAAYTALKVLIDAALDDAGIDNVTVTVLAERAVYFSDDVIGDQSYQATDLAGLYSPILLEATDGSLVKGTVTIDNTTGNFNGFYTQTDVVASADKLIAVDVELLKVGRGAEGGALTIGGMATDMANEWDYSDNAMEEGVEQFNVTVEGDNTQFSSLSFLQSTNNTLQEVIVDWADDSVADLIIGNHNTGIGIVFGGGGVNSVTTVMNNALKDVRLFEANNNNVDVDGNTNDVTVHAEITEESIDKYLDLTDTQADPAEEDVAFEYSFGAGDDTLNLNLSNDMLDAQQVMNRADFSLSIDTGAGDDEVAVQIGDGVTEDVGHEAWYINNNIQDNLSIDTGAGDDTIRANAGGSWIIDAGTGNDAVYSDNSGTTGGFNTGREVWVHNADNTDINALVSNGAVTTTDRVANISLTLTYQGLTSTVEVGTTHSNIGGVVTDLVINQAIKDAINNDEYLSDLLVAEDGPGRTLVIRSLTDGDQFDDGLFYSLTSAARTQAQQDNGVLTIAGATLTALDVDFDWALDGASSIVATANDIDAGSGSDTVVLSTSDLDTETVDVADGNADVVFNATNAVITTDIIDTVVLYNGDDLEGTVVTGAIEVTADLTNGSTIVVDADGGLEVQNFLGNLNNVLDLLAFTGDVVAGYEEVLTVAGDIVADSNVIVFGGATTLAAAAAAIAADGTVDDTDGVFVFSDGTDTFVYGTDNLAGDGTEVLLATLIGITDPLNLDVINFAV